MKREIGELFGEPYATLAVLLNDARGMGQGHAADPTRTARSSSSRSSTANPTRSSCCGAAEVDRVKDLIESAQLQARRARE